MPSFLIPSIHIAVSANSIHFFSPLSYYIGLTIANVLIGSLPCTTFDIKLRHPEGILALKPHNNSFSERAQVKDLDEKAV